MRISELSANAWDTAIEETAEYINTLNISPNEYTYSDWVVLEPFAIVYDLDFEDDGYLIIAERG